MAVSLEVSCLASALIQSTFRSAEVRREGAPVELSTLEIKLLRYFVEHRGAVVGRDELLDKVWGYDATPVTRTVDVHVASLRQNSKQIRRSRSTS